jgi:hypothetical protein
VTYDSSIVCCLLTKTGHVSDFKNAGKLYTFFFSIVAKSLTFPGIFSLSKIIERRNAQLSNYEVLALLRELDEKQKEQVRINPQIKFAENLKTIQFEVKIISY